jgi:hypothetical protein
MARTFRTISDHVEHVSGKLTDVVNAATNALDDLKAARLSAAELRYEQVTEGEFEALIEKLITLAERFENEADDVLVAFNRERDRAALTAEDLR